jgi:hypothetical protein
MNGTPEGGEQEFHPFPAFIHVFRSEVKVIHVPARVEEKTLQIFLGYQEACPYIPFTRRSKWDVRFKEVAFKEKVASRRESHSHPTVGACFLSLYGSVGLSWTPNTPSLEKNYNFTNNNILKFQL